MGFLENKAALITGAGAGIGRASALLFAQEGAKVALFSKTRQAVEETADRVRANGGDAVVIVGDVSNPEDNRLAVSSAVSAFGQLNCAFNNAGIEGQFGPLATLDDCAYDEVFNVNLKGVWLSMKHQIPALIEAGGGAIVNMSSNLSTKGTPSASLYTASKAGVDSLTRCGAMDYAMHNIRVNAVAPGIVENTAMTTRLWTAQQQQENRASSPTRRLSTPEDIAEATAWLCSDRAKHINGQITNIDGGTVTR